MNKLRVFIAIMIAIVWFAYYARAFFDTQFHPPAELAGLMLAVVTWLLGTEFRNIIKRSKTGDTEDD